MRGSAVDIAPAGWDDPPASASSTCPPHSRCRRRPSDPQEPNEDIVDVKAKGLFAQGHAPLTTRVRRAPASIKAMLDVSEDPEDVYRVVVPPKRTLTATLGRARTPSSGSGGRRPAPCSSARRSRKRDLLSRSEKRADGRSGRPLPQQDEAPADALRRRLARRAARARDASATRSPSSRASAAVAAEYSTGSASFRLRTRTRARRDGEALEQRLGDRLRERLEQREAPSSRRPRGRPSATSR